MQRGVCGGGPGGEAKGRFRWWGGTGALASALGDVCQPLHLHRWKRDGQGEGEQQGGDECGSAQEGEGGWAGREGG